MNTTTTTLKMFAISLAFSEFSSLKEKANPPLDEEEEKFLMEVKEKAERYFSENKRLLLEKILATLKEEGWEAALDKIFF